MEVYGSEQHLIALLMSYIFEGIGETYIKPKILDNFGEVVDVRDFSWCELMITLLIEHKQCWESYTCSILILVVSSIILNIYFYLKNALHYII